MIHVELIDNLLNQLRANLKYIEDPQNYFSMFKYVMNSCSTAEFANRMLFEAETLSDNEFTENVKRIQEARKNAIKTHLEWTIRTLEESKTPHTVRSSVYSVYSDIFAIE